MTTALPTIDEIRARRQRLMGNPKAPPVVKRAVPQPALVEPIQKAQNAPRVLDFVKAELPTYTMQYSKATLSREWQWKRSDITISAVDGDDGGLIGFKNWRTILTEVLTFYPGISIVEILGAGRSNYLHLPRWITWYRCRTELGMSYPQIARRFNRDHSTVLHGVEKLKQRLSAGTEESMKLRTQIEALRGRDAA